jgi:hypothetical protein
MVRVSLPVIWSNFLLFLAVSTSVLIRIFTVVLTVVGIRISSLPCFCYKKSTLLSENVGKISHGNSATKLVFRSSENTDLIAKTLNLSDEEINKIQSLPTQHCFLFSEDSNLAIQIKVLDIFKDIMSYTEYQSKMLKKYGKSVFPLLYNNFIDMRTSLYQKSQNEFMEKPIQKHITSKQN